MSVDGARLDRRLDLLRRNRHAPGGGTRSSDSDPDIRRAIAAIVAAGDAYSPPQPVWRDSGPVDPAALARRLAAALDGDAIETPHGWYVRRELRPVYLPIDRALLAGLLLRYAHL